MANMKLTRNEKETLTMISDDDHEGYPWGLQITLTGQELDKLGLGLKPVGAGCAFKAIAIVSNASKPVGEPNGERSMTLQITDMEMQDPDGPSAAEALYGELYKD